MCVLMYKASSIMSKIRLQRKFVNPLGMNGTCEILDFSANIKKKIHAGGRGTDSAGWVWREAVVLQC